MNHKTDMRQALQLCIDAMLHDGVPTDPEHPKRIALNAAEAALASRPDAQRCDGSGAVPISTDDYAECKACGGSGCKSVSHKWGDEGDRCVKCGDKDWMADASCSERLLKSTSRPDAQESLESENVVKDSVHKVSQGLAQADERGALMCERLRAMGLNPANEAADLIEQMGRASAPQEEAAQGVILDVEIRPIVMAGSPNACQVWLRHANGQQFAVGNPHETPADGEWFADQLRNALVVPSPDREQVGETPKCCDTPSYCSSVRRCTAKDAEQPKQSVPAPLSEYHEDTGPVVWWTWQDGLWLGEPSWIGTPTDSDWPGYHTHWTHHPEFPSPPLAEQPSERGEQECPHGQDDGACGWCYDEATRGKQGVLSDERILGEFVRRKVNVYGEDGEVRPLGDAVLFAVRSLLAASAPTLGESEWPSDRDAAIQACALMILGICKTRPQEVWPKAIEGRIRYMLTKLQPQAAEPKGLTDWREKCAALVDIYDDAKNNEPENRCYVDGAFRQEIDELRALLAKGE